ncbi:unnamed protein product [Sphagnum troendelagicum]
MAVPSPGSRRDEKRKVNKVVKGGGGGGKWKRKKVDDQDEIDALETRIAAGAPAPGSNPLAVILPKEDEEGSRVEPRPYVGAKRFTQLPLSDRSQRGLKEAKYTHMTAIQRASLPHALCGHDILGAAKTGSGKTLAFLIPVIEKLYRLRWGAMDGIGAVIISPTRELAMQIFDELRKVGKHHSLSGGLLIGGRKGVETEKETVAGLNILVCTPGRLLQHMDETPNFDCSQLQVLVLDEADRILDMGFAGTLNAILAQLSKERQTMLFSATQTRSVQDLARLSMSDPEFLAVHAESAAATPARLHQTAMIVPLDEKLDMLWSFIKTHLHNKTLVFLSSCKQVKFVHDAFRRLRPGVPLMCLHGRMKQMQRMVVFFKFCETKHAVLFATDVAARGLDFPTVDWVVQVDCPEDVPSYIHRVGRTARYTATGRSLMFLLPSEQSMLAALEAMKIPIKLIKANQAKMQPVSGALAGLLSKDPDLKYMAQRAFVTYLRSIHLRSDKSIFDVHQLPHAEYAASLGLPTTPRIRFLRKGSKSSKQGTAFVRMRAQDEDDMESDDNNGTDEDEFLQKKRPQKSLDEEDEDQEAKQMKAKSSGVKVLKKKKLKIDTSRAGGQRMVFDEEGTAMPPLAALAQQRNESGGLTEDIAMAAGERFRQLKVEMKQRDKEDRLLEKQRLREKRYKNKQKAKAGAEDDEDEAVGIKLGHAVPTDEISNSESEEEEDYRKRKGQTQEYESSEVEGGSEESDMHLRKQKSRGRKSRTVKREDEGETRVSGGVDELSLAEQEVLALKLLKMRRK